MTSTNIEKLKALLIMDEAGDDFALFLNEFLIDTRKRNVLMVKLHELRGEMATRSLEVKLTRSEETVRSMVSGSRKPLTAQEVAGKAGVEFRSLKYTSHASVTLNSLVSKGILGKFKLGPNYHYTNPKEAINEQLKRRGETPQECSPAEIAEETGMPLSAVLDAVEELMS